ncbi:G5 domain-containing protein [Microbacterium sp. 2FI]|uniref:G5 domain-containing protein n=1 Tax=Microbacterium sp. 2FI TaxID=2502193 RepID=UPI002017E7C8|nr:G5 domain-containing protein [Microbacterium sp. 2FI]
MLLVPAILLSPFVAAVALAIVVTGVVALAKGTPTWLRFRSRKAAAGVTAVAAAAFLVFGGVSAAAQAGRTDSGVTAARFTDSESSSGSDEVAKEPSSSPTPTPVTTVAEEVITEPVAFEESTLEDATMAEGETKITTIGKVGERTLTYRITLVDGEETKREIVSDVVTTEPISQVTSVGTYVAPPPPSPPPAQPAGCDSNYADACVPVASDVDCASGSGNGPAYFDGVARVVGVDIYDLDRNGDGFACEP